MSDTIGVIQQLTVGDPLVKIGGRREDVILVINP